MARSNEPIWWSLFSAGGVVAAFFLPVTILITGIVVPYGGLEAVEDLRELVGHPLTRLYLFVLISLPLFHWAHRFRYVAADFGLKKLSGVLPCICYGTAILGTVLAIVALV